MIAFIPGLFVERFFIMLRGILNTDYHFFFRRPVYDVSGPGNVNKTQPKTSVMDPRPA